MSAPEALFQKAVSALNQRDVAEAERLFKKVLQSKPNPRFCDCAGRRFAKQKGVADEKDSFVA